MQSLRRRALVGGAIWALTSTAVGTMALITQLDAIAERRFDEILRDRHLQTVVALGNSNGDATMTQELLFDPVYDRPYSGRYWQIQGSDGTLIASRSLFDEVLASRQLFTPNATFWQGQGPNGAVRGIAQKITLDNGTEWIVQVASSIQGLQQERDIVRNNLMIAMSFIGLLGVAGALLLTGTILSPLAKLRREVARHWNKGEELIVEDYPEEVASLVTNLNELMQRNREIVDRARRQAADLAHALKTPSAALRNELEGDGGNPSALEALNRIDAQISRSLARLRAANSASTVMLRTDLSNSINRMARLFRSLPDHRDKDLRVDIEEDLIVVMDAQDIEEVLGNMLENAFKWCRSIVALNVGEEGGFARILVEDDGPGIPEEQRRRALSSGGRLDVSVPGTGLGLAIASDLVHAYGGAIQLSHSSDLGGLCVTILVPTGVQTQANPAETGLAAE